MPSREYLTLRKNTDVLRDQFLNFRKRLDGAYTDYELTQCRAYITFCHSEVEMYFEEICTRVVGKAEKHWKRHSKVTNAIAAMLAYRLAKDSVIPDNPIEQGQKTKFTSLIGQAILAQKSAIKRNNGIKPKNLAELFIPLGMKSDQFEEALLIQLKNLGERRGDQVHQSSQISLPSIRDPFDDELHDISLLIAEIEAFDRLTAQLK